MMNDKDKRISELEDTIHDLRRCLLAKEAQEKTNISKLNSEWKSRLYAIQKENDKMKKERIRPIIPNVNNSINGQDDEEIIQRPSKSSLGTTMNNSVLSSDQITRYSRQLLLQDGFGVEGQRKLLSSSVLVVGAGGIGSSLLLYLASSGVGHITVVDFDDVDMSNLHRQIIHKNKDVGMNKAVSACRAMKDLNPTINCTPIEYPITFENAHGIVSKHDCVVDACDNPQTRYLLNDACILADKPLVSGSAMGTEGQLTVYNACTQQNENVNGEERESQPFNGEKLKKSCCYRCLYPSINPMEACKSCSDNGVLGPVPGLIGILQAIETIKILTELPPFHMHEKLLQYDALRCSFYSVRKPGPRHDCSACGKDDHKKIKSMSDSKEVSEMARGPNIIQSTITCLQTQTLPLGLNLSCPDYNRLREEGRPHVLIDVRVENQYEMCSLKGSVNIPLGRLESELDFIEEMSAGIKPIIFVCRRGIASVEATRILSNVISANKSEEIKHKGQEEGVSSTVNRTYPSIHSVFNVQGGLNAWAKEVDLDFPLY
mmetsp:Transcript_2829/g.4020  ORF Transcript_2829/g.4020 Transcript_2829/m.4020 type:complete len:545 (-) Transcript_2829:369-2003(-)